ncbi:AAA+ family ATPase [Roseitranquillus sediminis]|uniref:AAA+ family ATPase n=1 Tax=Roseitranquillus sediminis TaxID=2809051 RepID=UPI001D0CC948|nr:AAA+ family ATPase [Roseitranquillus sediminis]MBM9595764.1 AAA+ family ATPase [Roseitranquillus sediminis]
MKRLVVILVLCAAQAQAQVQEDGEVERGFDLLSRGAETLLRGLLGEMEPALQQLRELAGDLDAYEAPEMLPNGDIIIRRKTPLPDDEVPEEMPEGGIEL